MPHDDSDHDGRALARLHAASLAAARAWQPETIAEAVIAEQQNLWDDLATEIDRAVNRTWSIKCDALVDRIVSLAIFTGASPWDTVPARLIRNGVYRTVLESAGKPIRPSDWELADGATGAAPQPAGTG